jgi:hypothetical protein
VKKRVRQPLFQKRLRRAKRSDEMDGGEFLKKGDVEMIGKIVLDNLSLNDLFQQKKVQRGNIRRKKNLPAISCHDVELVRSRLKQLEK